METNEDGYGSFFGSDATRIEKDLVRGLRWTRTVRTNSRGDVLVSEDAFRDGRHYSCAREVLCAQIASAEVDLIAYTERLVNEEMARGLFAST